jgi:hypothetical protein
MPEAEILKPLPSAVQVTPVVADSHLAVGLCQASPDHAE